MTNQKQFGVWMDRQSAFITGKQNSADDTVSLIAQVDADFADANSSEKNEHNNENDLKRKYFKAITSHMQNATEVHVTGTGQIQEQFIHFLKETPQFKNTKATESTSNKMSEEKLIEYMAEKLN